MVDADVDDVPKASVVASRGHDHDVWLSNLSHLILAW